MPDLYISDLFTFSVCSDSFFFTVELESSALCVLRCWPYDWFLLTCWKVVCCKGCPPWLWEWVFHELSRVPTGMLGLETRLGRIGVAHCCWSGKSSLIVRSLQAPSDGPQNVDLVSVTQKAFRKRSIHCCSWLLFPPPPSGMVWLGHLEQSLCICSLWNSCSLTIVWVGCNSQREKDDGRGDWSLRTNLPFLYVCLDPALGCIFWL